MENNNPIYTAPELLKEESFLRWQLFRSSEDERRWKEYLQDHPEGQQEMEEAIRILRATRMNDYRLPEEENTALFQAIQTRIQQDKKKKSYWLYTVATSAAILLLALGLSQNFFRPAGHPSALTAYTDTVLKQNEILIILGDDQVLAFTDETEFKTDPDGNLHVLNQDQQIIQQNSQQSFNKLIVPKGKRSYLTLADGTRLWINSGTTVEFPPAFTGDTREIRVEGEVYLEVTENKEQPFLVITPSYTVTVLGTAFNISAYREDENSFVVLAEGAVEISTPAETIRMRPEQMATVSGESVRLDRVKVSSYISWKDGLLEFNSQSLSYILTRLNRYYDIPVSCDESIRNMKCTGKLVLFDSIEEVMETLAHTLSIRYELNNNDIYISKKEN